MDFQQVKEEINQALMDILETQASPIGDLSRAGAEELRELYGKGERPLALLSFDVDKIQDYVFASVKLLEINGASEVVKDLTRKTPSIGGSLPSCSVYQILKEKGLNENNVLFAGGGTGLLLLPVALAPQMAEEITDRFSKATSGAGSCTVAWISLYPHELKAGPDPLPVKWEEEKLSGIKDPGRDEKNNFGSVWRLLSSKLRQAKEEKINTTLVTLPGYISRCLSCGVRPSRRIDKSYEEEEKLCLSCYEHRNRGRKEKEKKDQLEMAGKIEDICGQGEGKRRYVGIIYLDANRMGQMLFQMEEPGELAMFSRRVMDIMEGIREEIIKKEGLKGRYQAPVIGGDDIMLIVPAEKSITLILKMVEELSRSFKEEAGKVEPFSKNLAQHFKAISMSVGLLIVPEHFNIRFSVNYAENLLKKAKEGFRDKGEECIDYMALTGSSPLSNDLEKVRESFYTRKGESWEALLTERPLTVTHLKELYGDICNLKEKVSRNQLRFIQNLIEKEPPSVARFNIQYQWVRVNEWWNGFFKKDKDMLLKWQEKIIREEDKGYFVSGINDILELYDFVEVNNDE